MEPRTAGKRVLRQDELPQYLINKEVISVIEAAGNERERLLLGLLWKTGASVSELVGGEHVRGIAMGDIDFAADCIHLATMKRKKRVRGRGQRVPIKTAGDRPRRRVPLECGLKQELLRFRRAEGIDDKTPFLHMTRLQAYRIVKRAALSAGIEQGRANPRILRHSFAVNCVRHGVPIHVLKEWLGHANIMNTVVYLKVLNEDENQYFARIRWDEETLDFE